MASKKNTESGKIWAPHKGNADKASYSRHREESAKKVTKDVVEDVDDGYGPCEDPILGDEKDGDSEEDVLPLSRKAKWAFIVGGRREQKVSGNNRRARVSPVDHNDGRRIRYDSRRSEDREL